MRVFSVDHKVIGPQYTILLSLLLAFGLILVLRWYLPWLTQPAPLTEAGKHQRCAPVDERTLGTDALLGIAHRYERHLSSMLIQGPAGLNRWPYDYSVPGAADDFLPPSQP